MFFHDLKKESEGFSVSECIPPRLSILSPSGCGIPQSTRIRTSQMDEVPTTGGKRSRRCQARERQLDALLTLQDDMCYVCHREIIEDAACDIDHKTRLADGGGDDLSNKCVLCISCHRAKTKRENSIASVYRVDANEPAHTINYILASRWAEPQSRGERYTIQQIRGWWNDKTMRIADCNRRSVWEASKKREFLLTLLMGGVTPPIYVNKLTKADERHVYDGGNRLSAIMDFMDGKLHIHVKEGRRLFIGSYGDTDNPKCERLSAAVVRRFDSIGLDMFEWNNLSTDEATEIAMHLNEGTPMLIGEKLRLITGRNTPRARILKHLDESDHFRGLVTCDRDRELKVLALFFRSVVSPDLTWSSRVSSNMGPLNHFYKSPEPVDERSIRCAERVLGLTASLLANRKKDQRKMIICFKGLVEPEVYDVVAALGDSDVDITVEQLLTKHQIST